MHQPAGQFGGLWLQLELHQASLHRWYGSMHVYFVAPLAKAAKSKRKVQAFN